MNILSLLFNVSDLKINRGRQNFNNLETKNADWLLEVGNSFFSGYNETLQTKDLFFLNEKAQQISGDLRGFFYEGIGAALGLKDILNFGIYSRNKKKFDLFLDKYAYDFPEVMFVGMGMTYGRSGLNPIKRANLIDQSYRRFLLDGFSFFQVITFKNNFSFLKTADEQDKFFCDLGIGRSFWFIENGTPEGILRRIQNFDNSRLPGIWEGLGVSMTYAGKANKETIRLLGEKSGPNIKDLLKGSQSAFEMRENGKNPAPFTTLTFFEISKIKMNAPENQKGPL